MKEAARPTFIIPARPLSVPEELTCLNPDDEVLIERNLAGSSEGSAGKASGAIEYFELIIERQRQGYYTMREAAEIIAAANGLDAADFLKTRMKEGQEPAPKLLLMRMMGALNPDHKFHPLKLIDPSDKGPVKGLSCRDDQDLVTPVNFDKWAEQNEFPYRWPLPAQDIPPPDKGAPEEEPTKNEPLPVETRIMKMAFGNLVGENTFSDVPKWIEPARVSKGRKRVPSMWNPIIAADKIIAHGIEEESVRRAMYRTNELRKWYARWLELVRERNSFGS